MGVTEKDVLPDRRPTPSQRLTSVLAPPAKAEEFLVITRSSLSTPPPDATGVVRGKGLHCFPLDLYTHLSLPLAQQGRELPPPHRKRLDTDRKKSKLP